MTTIRARDYTKLDEKKRFVPSELGIAVTRLLIRHLPDIMDTKFTANMEEDLDKVADGDLERDKLLRNFYTKFKEDLARFKGDDDITKSATVPTGVLCPKCKENNLNIRFGRSGEFLGCANYPDCTFTSNFERTESGELKIIKTEEPVMLKEKCPECSESLRSFAGKFGQFTACSATQNANTSNVKLRPSLAHLMAEKWCGVHGAAANSGDVITIRNASSLFLMRLKKRHAHNAKFLLLLKR